MTSWLSSMMSTPAVEGPPRKGAKLKDQVLRVHNGTHSTGNNIEDSRYTPSKGSSSQTLTLL